MGFFDLFFNWISWSLWRLRWYSDGKSWTKKKPFSVERTSRLTFPSKRGEFKISSILLTIWPFDYLTVWLQYLDIDIIQSYMYWYCLINAFCLVLNRPIICDVVMLTFSAVLWPPFFFSLSIQLSDHLLHRHCFSTYDQNAIISQRFFSSLDLLFSNDFLAVCRGLTWSERLTATLKWGNRIESVP